MFQHDFILIDRSGSMGRLWEEALTSVNAYVAKLAEDNVDTGVTVVFFDSHAGMSFDIVRDRITPKTFRKLSNKDGTPRGGTPLSDAVGKLVSLAESGNYDKVAIVIMTDGDENSSQEYSVAAAKAALDRCRNRDWAVTFLGANFQNDRQATSYGSVGGNNVFTSAKGLSATLGTLGMKRAVYASASVGNAAETTMTFTTQEKEDAAKQ